MMNHFGKKVLSTYKVLYENLVPWEENPFPSPLQIAGDGKEDKDFPVLVLVAKKLYDEDKKEHADLQDGVFTGFFIQYMFWMKNKYGLSFTPFKDWYALKVDDSKPKAEEELLDFKHALAAVSDKYDTVKRFTDALVHARKICDSYAEPQAEVIF